MHHSYDAILLVSFGGPEGMDDVMPFLEHVLRGKQVPHDRILEAARPYEQFGGVSPINAQNRALIAVLKAELEKHDLKLPVYWGNRNWHPFLEETMKKMTTDGVRRAMAFVTTAYSSYSTCRQYLEDIRRAQQTVGPEAPRVDKLRAFYNHPGFVEPVVERVRDAVQQIPPERRPAAHFVYTAHSIPVAMAETCRYELQLKEVSCLVTERVGNYRWTLVYQSRSGPPHQPWLEPDVCTYLEHLRRDHQVHDVVVVPIGFISDHMEVVYDLDTEAKQLCDQIGLNMVRAATVGTHPRFVSMIRKLIAERLTEGAERTALGVLGPDHDACSEDCCPLLY